MRESKSGKVLFPFFSYDCEFCFFCRFSSLSTYSTRFSEFSLRLLMNVAGFCCLDHVCILTQDGISPYPCASFPYTCPAPAYICQHNTTPSTMCWQVIDKTHFARTQSADVFPDAINNLPIAFKSS